MHATCTMVAYRHHDVSMASLTVRNIDARLKEQLRVRAAHNGRSMEAEMRQILTDALGRAQKPEHDLAEAIRRRFAPLGGVDDLEPHPSVSVSEPPTFE